MGTVHTASTVEQVSFSQAWRHQAGHTAVIRLGQPDLHLDTIEEARALLTAVLAAYQGLARLEADPMLRQVMPDAIDTGAIEAALGAATALAVDAELEARRVPHRHGHAAAAQ